MRIQFDLTGCTRHDLCNFRYLSEEDKQLSAWFQTTRSIAILAVRSGTYQGHEVTSI